MVRPKWTYFVLTQFRGGARTPALHFWRERAAFQRSAFGRSTAGNDVVATIFNRPFFFSPFFFSVATFSHGRSALIKTLVPKNIGVHTFQDPIDRRGAAGGERVPPAHSGSEPLKSGQISNYL